MRVVVVVVVVVVIALSFTASLFLSDGFDMFCFRYSFFNVNTAAADDDDDDDDDDVVGVDTTACSSSRCRSQ